MSVMFMNCTSCSSEDRNQRYLPCWWLRTRTTRWGWRGPWFAPLWRMRTTGPRSVSPAAPSSAAPTGSHGVAARGRSTASAGCCTVPEARTSYTARENITFNSTTFPYSTIFWFSYPICIIAQGKSMCPRRAGGRKTGVRIWQLRSGDEPNWKGGWRAFLSINFVRHRTDERTVERSIVSE